MYILRFLSLVLAMLASGFAPDTFAQQLLYIHADHLNTPRLVTNGSGTPVWRWDQTEPFGDNLPNEDPDGNGTPGHMPLRFPGQYFDKETGLAYNMARDYASDTGRYIQSDPIGLAGGINTYAYVGGNPISFSDPSGLFLPALAIPALSGTGMSAATGLVTTVGALIIGGAAVSTSSGISDTAANGPKTEQVPKTCTAANDGAPNDCQVRQQALLKEWNVYVQFRAKGFTILPDVKRDYDKRAVLHNIRCKNYPVPTFGVGPQGSVQ